MKLLAKIREYFSGSDDMPEIFEDMHEPRNASFTELFHTRLNIIVDERDISYFDAFVVHMKEDSGVHFENRFVFRHYLFHQGLSEEDVDNLVEEFYRVEMPNGPDDLG